MDKLENQASLLIRRSYVKQGLQGIATRHNALSQLLSERRIPINGWDDCQIEFVLNELAMMDSNNFPTNTGVGEREGRIFSNIVAKRHFYLSHGIGRSGDISEVQPKAAGSSIIYQLTNALVMSVITKICGFTALKHGIVLPLATGMSLALCVISLKSTLLPTKPQARYVIWPRIDQKSGFKCIFVAGLIPIVVENILVGDQLETDVSAIEQTIVQYGAENIVCVLSTTSCFAPRRPDKVDEIARVCKKYDVGHVVNNAYGLQCASIMRLVNRACVVGRVDYVVQSTDKNFMVPVGGAIVASPIQANIDTLSRNYAGRAGIGPILDLFITLLSMGETKLRQLLSERERLFALFKHELGLLSVKHPSVSVLATPDNHISIGLALRFNAPREVDSSEPITTNSSEVSSVDVNSIGSILFHKCISGSRLIYQSPKPTSINGHSFLNWGSHANSYPRMPYLTVAVAIGMTEPEIHRFISELGKVLHKFEKKGASGTKI